MQRRVVNDVPFGLRIVTAFRERLRSERIPVARDQIHLTVQHVAPVHHGVAIELVVVPVRVEHIHAMRDLMIDRDVRLDVVRLQPFVRLDEIALVLELPREVVQADVAPDRPGKLQDPVAAVAIDAVRLLDHAEIVRRLTRAEERRDEIRLRELHGEPAALVVEALRPGEILDPQVHVAEPAWAEIVRCIGHAIDLHRVTRNPASLPRNRRVSIFGRKRKYGNAHVLYRDFETTEAIDAEYDMSIVVGDLAPHFAFYVEQSESARAELDAMIDVPFGPTVEETLDIFPAASPDAPIVVFIHGGYWRRLSSKEFSYVARGLVARGITAVVTNYALCPKVTIPEITRQSRAAVAFVRKTPLSFNGDRESDLRRGPFRRRPPVRANALHALGGRLRPCPPTS